MEIVPVAELIAKSPCEGLVPATIGGMSLEKGLGRLTLHAYGFGGPRPTDVDMDVHGTSDGLRWLNVVVPVFSHFFLLASFGNTGAKLPAARLRQVR